MINIMLPVMAIEKTAITNSTPNDKLIRRLIKFVGFDSKIQIIIGIRKVTITKRNTIFEKIIFIILPFQ